MTVTINGARIAGRIRAQVIEDVARPANTVRAARSLHTVGQLQEI
ncbi:hypothetical protein [Streptomyces sp. CA-111067]